MRTALAALIVAGGALAADGLIVTDDLRHGPVRGAHMVGLLDEERFRQAALRLLSPRTVRIGTVTAHRTREDARRAGPQEGTDCTHGSWLGALEFHRLVGPGVRCPERMQALKLGDSLVLRLSDARCGVRQEVVRGAGDPLRVELAGARMSVLDMVVSETGGRRQTPHAALFVVTDGAVTTERARAAVRHVRRLSPGLEVSVTLRSDPWFAAHCELPLLSSLLGRPGSPPTREQFVSGREVHCTLLEGWPLRCH